ncbi:acyltransferase [Hydrocarboniphaga sp.]|uniref:acyltransferase family protein n=1 Tax=Hydrocarboniphaga sp. TaxID=2033016 RepID=UPI002AB9416A|nr:acyltransferase [Hydrocarboniphaga sp.]MDZ4078360.1 acyltransferase [Hydrocarboniphaga sp.]
MKRLTFLDVARGIAALAVLFQHAGESTLILVKYISENFIQIGQFGVALFFIVSGYVIPFSAQKQGSVRVFWSGRFFRLYPAYWFVIALFLISGIAGLHHKIPVFSPWDYFANLTMLYWLNGSSYLLGVFWSLKFELTFYIIISLLIPLGSNRVSAYYFHFAISAITVILSIKQKMDSGVFGSYGLYYLALMFYGWSLHDTKDKEGSVLKAMVSTAVQTLLALTVGKLAFGTAEVNYSSFGSNSLVPMIGAWVGAIIVFLVFRYKSEIKWHASLVYLGVISYSIYLVHGPIIYIIRNFVENKALSFSLSILLSIVAAKYIYEFIETPAMKLGKYVSGSRSKIKDLNGSFN